MVPVLGTSGFILAAGEVILCIISITFLKKQTKPNKLGLTDHSFTITFCIQQRINKTKVVMMWLRNIQAWERKCNLELRNTDCKHRSNSYADFFFFNYCLDFTELASLAWNKPCEEGELEASPGCKYFQENIFLLTIYQLCHRRTIVAPALISNSCSHLQTESTEIEGL